MELLVVIVGVVLVWKFSSVLNALSMAGRVKAEVMCEEVLIEASEERADLYASFSENMKGKEIKSHQEILTMLKMKK